MSEEIIRKVEFDAFISYSRQDTEFAKKQLGFISSIYGRVVFIIVGSFIILLILFNIVFHSLYDDYFDMILFY